MARDGLDISGISNLATVALMGYIAFKGIAFLEKPKVAGQPTTITGSILSDVGGGIVSDVGGGVFQFGVSSGNAAGSYVVDAAGNIINILGGVVGTVFTAGAYFGDAVGQQVLGAWNRLRGDTVPPEITLPVIEQPTTAPLPAPTPSGQLTFVPRSDLVVNDLGFREAWFTIAGDTRIFRTTGSGNGIDFTYETLDTRTMQSVSAGQDKINSFTRIKELVYVG